MNIPRGPVAVVAGVVATFGLFFVMQWLIEMNVSPEEEERGAQLIDFVRLPKELEIETKKRKLPEKKQEKPRPPPDIDMARAPRPQVGMTAGISIPRFSMRGISMGGAPSDMDVIPLVRIPPQYPRRAQQLGIEGWVLLEFTITPAGTVTDAEVIDSEPRRVFDRAALRAIERYKYKPKIENGQPVARTGMQIVIEFELEDT